MVHFIFTFLMSHNEGLIVESEVTMLQMFRRKRQLKPEQWRRNLISGFQENTTTFLRKILNEVHPLHLHHHHHHHHQHHDHHHIMELGHLFTPSGITHREVTSVALPGSSCLLVCTSYFQNTPG
jgi:hypothetical protein